jgi:predicted transcriptional regulator
MCQEEILKYLIKNKNREIDIRELITKIPVNRSNISRACNKLRLRGEIKFRLIRNFSRGIPQKYLYSI